MLEVAIAIPFWLELAAALTGGLSGAMSAVRARFDIFGCVFIACATGLGGGITRDVLLQDYGIYAFQNPSLLLSCAVAGVAVFYFGKLATYLDPIVDLLDNLSVAMWAIIGVGKSLSAGLDVVPSIILGTITAIGGGVMRDVLMNRPPEAFQAGPLYGSAALVGCAAFGLMREYHFFPSLAAGMCAALVLGIRYGSLVFGWSTRPPRDYSDKVTNAVVKPMQFVARKARVPLGKTARDRGDSGRLARAARLWTRFYNRVSGRWMELRDTGRDDGRSPHGSCAEGAEADCVHWDDVPPEADVPYRMAPPPRRPGGRGGSGEPEAVGRDASRRDESGPGAPDPSDRLFVNRDELRRVMGAIDGHTDAEPRDPFEPRS